RTDRGAPRARLRGAARRHGPRVLLAAAARRGDRGGARPVRRDRVRRRPARDAAGSHRRAQRPPARLPRQPGGDARRHRRADRSLRSRERILAAAGAVLPAGGPVSAGEPGGEVRFWRCASERAQAQSVAAEVARLLRAGTAPEQVAVLVRSVRNEGQAVAVALEERAVPHHLVGDSAFFQRAEVRDVLAWLRLLVNPPDAGAVARARARPPG